MLIFPFEDLDKIFLMSTHCGQFCVTDRGGNMHTCIRAFSQIETGENGIEWEATFVDVENNMNYRINAITNIEIIGDYVASAEL